MLASSVMPQLAPAQHAALCRRQPLGTVRLTTRVRGGAPSHAAHLRGGAPSRTLRPACASAGGDWAVEYLVDMECPLRRAEVDSLKGIDRNRRISFVDISSRSYSPAAHGGVTYEDAMGAPAAHLPDGTVVRSAEVYASLYGAVGLSAVWKLTRLPGVRVIVDAVFNFWTNARLPLTGRGSLAQVLAKREAEDRR